MVGAQAGLQDGMEVLKSRKEGQVLPLRRQRGHARYSELLSPINTDGIQICCWISSAGMRALLLGTQAATRIL